MKQILLISVIVLLLTTAIATAHEINVTAAKELIDSGVSCDNLDDQELEAMGEYYMEQMHPGESHELMHKMMGLEESSETEKQFHINMAKTIYCNENVDGMYSGMMGGGMMNMMGSNMMGSGMMGSWGYGSGYWNFINILYVILLIGLVVLVYLWIIKLWKKMK